MFFMVNHPSPFRELFLSTHNDFRLWKDILVLSDSVALRQSEVRKMSNHVEPGHQGCGFGVYFSDHGVEEEDTSWIIMLCTNSHFD